MTRIYIFVKEIWKASLRGDNAVTTVKHEDVFRVKL